MSLFSLSVHTAPRDACALREFCFIFFAFCQPLFCHNASIRGREGEDDAAVCICPSAVNHWRSATSPWGACSGITCVLSAAHAVCSDWRCLSSPSARRQSQSDCILHCHHERVGCPQRILRLHLLHTPPGGCVCTAIAAVQSN